MYCLRRHDVRGFSCICLCFVWQQFGAVCDVCPLLCPTVSGHSKPGYVAEDAATMVEEGVCYSKFSNQYSKLVILITVQDYVRRH